MGRAIYFHATSTSHGKVKTCWAGLERWGGGAMAPRSLLQVQTHTKENKMEANGAFFTNFDIFSTLFCTAF